MSIQFKENYFNLKKKSHNRNGRETFDIFGLNAPKSDEDSLQKNRILFEGFLTIRPAASSIDKQRAYHV